MVASQADFDKSANKVKCAETQKIAIVSFDWLVECLANNTREDEAKYSLSTSPPGGGSASDGKDAKLPMKRTANTALTGDDDQAGDKTAPENEPWG